LMVITIFSEKGSSRYVSWGRGKDEHLSKDSLKPMTYDWKREDAILFGRS